MSDTIESTSYKYKMVIAYDGTHYHGWQMQPNGLTIQEVLQDKLHIILKEPTPVVGAGRTDAGVHALGQTAHFSHANPLDAPKVLRSLNGLLPPDIRVKSLDSAPQDFHARFSAVNKIYHYHLNLSAVPDPFLRLYSWHIPERLNLEGLQDAAACFLGTHDFSAFANEASLGAAGKNPIRTIKRIEIVPQREGIRLEFEAGSFLYKMVRNLTGTLIEVAKGKRSIEEIEAILASRDRRRSGRAAPAKGLFLMRVDYN